MRIKARGLRVRAVMSAVHVGDARERAEEPEDVEVPRRVVHEIVGGVEGGRGIGVTPANADGAALEDDQPAFDTRRVRTRDDFIRLVDEALHENDSAAAATRQAAVASGTWDARAEWVSDLIEEVLVRKEI